MAKLSPKKALERLEKIENALKQQAPAGKFGAIGSSDFSVQVQKSRDARAAIIDLENQLRAANNSRDVVDTENLRQAQLVVNGVIGDPEFGPDSSLYETMGFIRKSERKSGLTRKKQKTNPTP
jgi:hypothetical protein